MPVCTAINCTSRTGKKYAAIGRTFHRFPMSNSSLTMQWVCDTKRDNFTPVASSRLCSDHFTENCFDRTDQTTRLREDAVPTLSKFPEHLVKMAKFQNIDDGSSEPSAQRKDIIDLFSELRRHLVPSLEAVDEESNRSGVRDKILLISTEILNALDKTGRTESGKCGIPCLFCDSDLEAMFSLIDGQDPILSYSSCQLVKKLSRQPGCEESMKTLLCDQWCRMLSQQCTSHLGILHRIDIMRDIFSQKFSGNCDNGLCLQGVKISISTVIFDHWEEFLSLVFVCDSDISKSHLHHNIIFSTCCLWIKLVRQETQKLFLGLSTSNAKIFDRSTLLLDRLKTNSLPSFCVRKCLDVLLECLPFSSFLSPMKVVPVMYDELALKYLQGFLREGNFRDFSFVDQDYLRFASNVSSCLSFEWIRSCVIRNSVSQGFGGYVHENYLEKCASSSAGVSVKAKDPDEMLVRGITEVDETALRKFSLLLLKFLAVFVRSSRPKALRCDVCLVLMNSMEALVCSLVSVNPSSWLLELFQEQDDDLLEALLCLLDIYSFTSDECSDGFSKYEPCALFLQFLDGVFWDPSLLLDLLMSPETCFLLYFTRLLKHLLNNWNCWTSTCLCYGHKSAVKEKTVLDTVRKENSTAANADSFCSRECPEKFLRKDFVSYESEKSIKELEDEESISTEPRKISSLKQLQQNYSSPSFQVEQSNCLSLCSVGVKVSTYLEQLRHKHADVSGDVLSNHNFCRPLDKERIETSNDSHENNLLQRELVTEDNDDDINNSSEVSVDSPNRLCHSVNSKVCKKLIDYSDSESENGGSDMEVNCEDFDDRSVSKELGKGSEMSSTESDSPARSANESLMFTGSCVPDEPCGEADSSTCDTSRDNRILDNAMTCFIQLRLSLERLVSKDIFPFNIRPLLRLLRLCEQRYDESNITVC